MKHTNTLSRKQFLKVSTLALTGAVLTGADLFAKSKQKVGLQLYTLREELSKDVEGTLKKVASLNYQEVELFGYADGKYFGKSPKEFRALLQSLNLTAPSGHYLTGNTMPGMKGTLKNEWNMAAEHAAEVGQKYMICAFLFPEERKTLDNYKQHAELFNQAAEICKKNGLQFGYHNHDFEFVQLEGQVPYDLLLKDTDAKLVQMELDLYWISFAGKDPIAYFKQHPGRFPMWHVKDMEKGGERSFTEVGNGSIDFQRIFDAKKTAGLQHFFVEQDVSKRTPLESIEISINNLKKIKT